MNLNPLQQRQFSQEFNNEMQKVTMSWNNDLHKWYPVAFKALDFASCADLQIPQNKYSELFKRDDYGLNMNVIAVLANNLERRTPSEMGYSATEWEGILQLNQGIANNWDALADPIRKTVMKRVELMAGKKIMQPVIGEA